MAYKKDACEQSQKVGWVDTEMHRWLRFHGGGVGSNLCLMGLGRGTAISRYSDLRQGAGPFSHTAEPSFLTTYN